MKTEILSNFIIRLQSKMISGTCQKLPILDLRTALRLLEKLNEKMRDIVLEL